MTSTRFEAALADLVRPGGGLDLGHDQARLTVRMLQLLAHGRPVALDDALDATVDLGVDRPRAEVLLDAWAERNDDGDIVGLGLTYNPTAHEMTGDGNRGWAWCAMDTLIFAIILDTPVTIASTVPSTRQMVRLHATPSGIVDADPADTVITHPVRTSDQVDLTSTAAIWASFCHHSFYFPTRAHAEEWAAGRDDIEILSLDEGFEVAVAEAGALMRYEPDGAR
ncbi:MAG: organomercurial lyase [Actinomycetota bacterium]